VKNHGTITSMEFWRKSDALAVTPPLDIITIGCGIFT
jgi:hypothetical protein